MMLLLVGLLIAWVLGSLFALALCVAAYRGDRAMALSRPARADASRARRFQRAS
jgi:hypothetical protein